MFVEKRSVLSLANLKRNWRYEKLSRKRIRHGPFKQDTALAAADGFEVFRVARPLPDVRIFRTVRSSVSLIRPTLSELSVTATKAFDSLGTTRGSASASG